MLALSKFISSEHVDLLKESQNLYKAVKYSENGQVQLVQMLNQSQIDGITCEKLQKIVKNCIGKARSMLLAKLEVSHSDLCLSLCDNDVEKLKLLWKQKKNDFSSILCKTSTEYWATMFKVTGEHITKAHLEQIEKSFAHREVAGFQLKCFVYCKFLVIREIAKTKPELCVAYFRKTVAANAFWFQMHRSLTVKLCKTSLTVQKCLQLMHEMSVANVPEKAFSHLSARVQDNTAVLILVHEAKVSHFSTQASIWLDYMQMLRQRGLEKDVRRVHQRALELASDKTLLIQ